MARRSDTRRKAINRIFTLRDLRTEKRALEERIGVTQSELIALLDTLSIKSLSVIDPKEESIKITATKVTGSTLEFDQAKLRKKLGTATWNKVTTRTLDRAKLESLIASGAIDPLTIAECATEKEKKPYVRITEKLHKS